MEKTAKRLYIFLKKKRWIRTDSVRRIMTGLSGKTDRQTEEMVEAYYVGSLKRILSIFTAVIIIAVLLWIADSRNRQEDISITRGDYGEEETVYALTYEDEDNNLQEVTVTVDSVKYSPEELEIKFQECFTCLEQEMLGENAGLDSVQGNLNLLTQTPAAGITAAWSSEDCELIDSNGTVYNEKLSESRQVSLRLELSYEERMEYREYEITVEPRAWTREESRRNQIQTELEQMIKEAPYEKEIRLPQDIQGVRLWPSASQVSRGWAVLGFGTGICILLWFQQKEILRKKEKEKKKQLLKEYPNLVNQLLLYMGAGSTIKGAFERIRKQYERAGKQENPLYLELNVMWNEMQTGVTQEAAYLNLGKRTGLLCYMKLTTLLSQQIRKGSAGIALQLEQEEHMAFEQRKERAKRYGEEAGTKLLFPMIILMIISMIIVVCPALMNFHI